MTNNSTQSQTDLTEFFGPVIYQYTRAQAIADGELVDITATAAEIGFRYPFAVSRALWAALSIVPRATSWQDRDGRLWDCLVMAKRAVLNAPEWTPNLVFEVILSMANTPRKHQTLMINLGRGDEGEMVFTMGFPGDF